MEQVRLPIDELKSYLAEKLPIERLVNRGGFHISGKEMDAAWIEEYWLAFG